MPPTVGGFINSQSQFKQLWFICVFINIVMIVYFPVFLLCSHKNVRRKSFVLTNHLSLTLPFPLPETISISFFLCPSFCFSLFSPGTVRIVSKLAFCFCVYQCSVTYISCRYCESPGDGTVWQHSTSIVLRLQSRSQSGGLKWKCFLNWHFFKGLFLAILPRSDKREGDRKHGERAGGIPCSKRLSQYQTREMVMTC